MPTKEFYQALTELLLPLFPKRERDYLIRQARARAGGRRKGKTKRKLSRIERAGLTSLLRNLGSFAPDELKELHDLVHQVYGIVFDEEKELLLDLHEGIEARLKRRRKLEEQVDEAIKFCEKLPDVINWIPGFLSITGSFIYRKEREPNDLDVILCLEGKPGEPTLIVDSGIWLKIRRALEEALGKEISNQDVRFAETQVEEGRLVLRVKSQELIPKIEETIGQFTDLPVVVTVTHYGANWPHLKVYDLCLVKRKNIRLEEIYEPGFEKLRKEIVAEDVEKAVRIKDPGLREQAEKARKEDKLRPFQFFETMKPIRGAKPGESQTIESFLDLVEPHLPGFVSKKYDGVSCVFLKDGNKVLIATEDGVILTDKLPQLRERLKKLNARSVSLVGEIELWKEGSHYPREAANAAIVAGRDLEHLKANFHDIVLYNDRDIHKLTERERLDILDKLKFDESTYKVPKKETLFNKAPRIYVRTRQELLAALKEMSSPIHSEGVVFDRDEGLYSLKGEPRAFARWKWHKNASANVILLERITTKGGVWVYWYGLDFDVKDYKPDEVREFKGKNYIVVGRTFGRKLKLEPGTIAVVEAETINQIINKDKGTLGISFWAPNLLKKSDAERPDKVSLALRRAKEENILQTKIIEDGKTVYIPKAEAKIVKENPLEEEENNPSLLEPLLKIKKPFKPERVKELSDAVLQDDFRLLAAHFAKLKRGEKSGLFKNIKELLYVAKFYLQEIYRRGKITFHPPKK